MDKLLPCPFCGGEARIMLEEDDRPDDCFHNIYCTVCGAQFWVKSKSEAISAWNRRAQPENEPLTLDELRQMDGEPVWVIPINLHEWICDARDGKSEWGMARKSWVRIWRSETADLMHTDFDFEDYGKIWLAYRRKPERSEGE